MGVGEALIRYTDVEIHQQAVSYTHLDVYKRQVDEHGIRNALVHFGIVE